MFEIMTQICQEYIRIGDSSYMEKFKHKDFLLLFYLFIYLFLNNYF